MRREVIEDVFRAIPILRTVPPKELVGLTAERVEQPEGGRFFAQGDPSDAIYGVVEGSVRILKRTLSGRELCLEVLGPGDVIGAAAVMRGMPMQASCVAAEPSVLVRVPADAFRRLLGRNPGLGNRILDVISSRLLEASRSRTRHP